MYPIASKHAMIGAASIQALPLSFVKPILAILAHEQEEAINFGPFIERANGRLYPSPHTAEAASVWPGRRRLAQTADALASL